MDSPDTRITKGQLEIQFLQSNGAHEETNIEATSWHCCQQGKGPQITTKIPSQTKTQEKDCRRLSERATGRSEVKKRGE